MKLYGLAVMGLLTACAANVRPAKVSDANTIAAGAAAKQSEQLVPQAFAIAEKLRLEANQAADEGKAPLAEIKAERAIAAYAHAQVLARVAKAEQQSVAAKAELARLEAESLALEAKRTAVAAELTALDTQVEAAREAESLEDAKATTPDREAARLRLAKSTLMQARLLCAGASLQTSDTKAVDALVQAVSELGATLEKSPRTVPVVQAIRLRSQCQEQLSLAKRPARLASPNAAGSDKLFVELSRLGLAPTRDDRGIVVTQPVPVAEKVVNELVQAATAFEHPPVLVVTHRRKGASAASEKALGDSLEKKLRDAGLGAVRVVPAGDSLPVESYLGGKAPAQDRVEFVFVTQT